MTVNLARKLTPQEFAQGWADLGCKCGHAFVFRAAVVGDIPVDKIELCPETNAMAVRKVWLETVQVPPD